MNIAPITALSTPQTNAISWPWNRPHAPLPTVASVDPVKYSGLWYEIARLPVRFQKANSVSTAEYGVRPDGNISVHNSAFIGARLDAEIRGTAKPVVGSNNARLSVGFGGLLKLIPKPKEGNYWVLDLKPDYSMALVGSPDRSNLWLLARDSHAYTTADAARMLAKAAKLGYDTSKLQVADWDKRMMRPGTSGASADVTD